MTYITVVSGLPRSGTSMMMAMLKAGGLQLLTDKVRQADDDNPRGYYEYEKVKMLQKDASWLQKAQGKAVKIVSPLLVNLPDQYEYKLIFMERNLKEIVASQRRMLEKQNRKPIIDDLNMEKLYVKYLQQVTAWLAAQRNFSICYVSFNNIFIQPMQEINRVTELLDGRLDATAMLEIIDKSLYRNKATTMQ